MMIRDLGNMAVVFILFRMCISVYFLTISSLFLKYIGKINSNQKNIAPSQLRSFGLCVSFLHYRSATREFENPAAAQPVMLT